MSLVLDSSVSLAWCFADEHTPAVTAVLDRVADTGATAPLLWPLEITNGLLAAQRRGRVDAPRRAGLVRFLQALPVTLDSETASRIWTDTIRLAEQHGLTIYDAAYLELAIRLGLPLATLDQDLRAGARAMAVPLLGA